MRKGIYYGFLPGETPEEKFAAAARYSFECVEIPTLESTTERNRYFEAAQANGIKIPSIMNDSHWEFYFSHPDRDVRARAVEGMQKSLETAVAVGADTVLLVPALVNEHVTYQRAWEVSQVEIDKLIPDYEENQVYIACENVWNKFLLSPMEFVRYIDEFDSRWVGAYFDVGNIVMYGYPEQWIATLGERIKKVHIKGFDGKTRTFCNLLDGTINWKAVNYALRSVGYDDVMTAELECRGCTKEEEAQKISGDMDEIFKMF